MCGFCFLRGRWKGMRGFARDAGQLSDAYPTMLQATTGKEKVLTFSRV
uniref:Uncharacterized protein n=1 Tax=uncultured Bacteroidota bacterium TaxID=152509 RepID=H5SMT9_9BACT|nr:hypothetical protein HGMM_F50F04C38 [uncultured Bacteroidetes bacterium]